MMLVMVIFAAVIIAAGWVFYSYYSSDIMLASAISHYENNDQEKAAELFRSYLVAKKNDPRPRIYLAKICFKNKEYIDAVKECIAVTVNNYAALHEKAEAYGLIAEIYIEQNMIDKAGKAAIEGLRKEPKNEHLHFQLGRLFFITDKYDKASKEFNFVLTTDRNHVPARMMLSKIHEKMRDDTNAIFQYKRIIEIDSNNNEARYNLANIYNTKGELQLAVEEIEKLTEEKDKDVQIQCASIRSNYYLKLKNNQKAKEIIEKIAFLDEKRNDKLTFMRYELAVIYEEEGQLVKANDLYESIKADIPRYKDVEQRILKIRKTLHPEEHAKIVEQIDYNSLSNIEFEEMLAKIINKLGYKEIKVVSKNRNSIMMICVEKFKTLLQGKYLIQLLRSFDKTSDVEVMKFVDRVADEGALRGILISTATYTDAAVEIAKDVDNIEILDKLSIYEVLS